MMEDLVVAQHNDYDASIHRRLVTAPATATTQKRQRRRPRHKHKQTPTDLLNHNDDKDHKGDLSSTLEHLIAVGFKEQREVQRYHAFYFDAGSPLPCRGGKNPIPRHPTTTAFQGDGDDDGDEFDEEETTRSRGNKGSALKEAFVEDIRLYGETYTAKYDGLERSPWPGSKRLLSAAAAKTSKSGSIILPRNNNSSSMDEHWELEYGDSIHPLAFSMARLSSQQLNTAMWSSSEEELAAINGLNLNVATTETSLPENDVPRALLLRCWQRAVEAASQQATSVTVGLDAMEGTGNIVNLGTTDQDAFSRHLLGSHELGLVDSTLDPTGLYIPPPRAVKEPPFAAAQKVMAQDRFGVKRKCTSLGLGLIRAQLPMDISKGTCPACYRQFEQPNELQQHYYGGRDRRGCCWRRIAQKEPRVVAGLLENNVKSQINQYLGLIMDQASRKLAENGNVDSTSTKAFTWYDVLQFTEEALNSSHSVATSTADPRNGIHPIFETFQRKSVSDPLVLNPTVLRNARKRLVDR